MEDKEIVTVEIVLPEGNVIWWEVFLDAEMRRILVQTNKAVLGEPTGTLNG